MGPITMTLLGCIFLAVLITVVLLVLKRVGLIEQQMAQTITWGTCIIIGLIIAILVLNVILAAFGAGSIRLP